ncbi:hypothetical protein OF83DRAFT_845325 [Amylostereum chailletii]|nr:hypothetical protein OF83DRAFT_845325 [Amylostereum chailletii]
MFGLACVSRLPPPFAELVLIFCSHCARYQDSFMYRSDSDTRCTVKCAWCGIQVQNLFKTAVSFRGSRRRSHLPHKQRSLQSIRLYLTLVYSFRKFDTWCSECSFREAVSSLMQVSWTNTFPFGSSCDAH